MTKRVVSIVVTYNRKELLLQTIRALLDQTVPIEQIIVIDNASSDGTEELFVSNGRRHGGRVDYYNLRNNVGGAGGFAFGIGKALDTHGQWFWLMDDDVCPRPDCLEILLSYSSISECLHPRKVRLDGGDYYWEQMLDVRLARTHILPNPSFTSGKAITFGNVGCFEGMLVSRRIVDIIGLPDKKYFIVNDDTLYGFKASMHTNVGFVRDAIIHKTVSPGAAKSWKIYYIVRNVNFLHRDCMDYLGMRSGSKGKCVIFACALYDVIRNIPKGPSYVLHALRGAIHGLQYAFKARSINNDNV